MYNVRLCLITDVYCDHVFRLVNSRFKENFSHFLFVEINELHLNFFFIVFWGLIEQKVFEIDDKMAITSRNI